ncbi:H-type small acid-soluble spore protein [Lederbergia graminis]|uniref:H-type small acid-soluble spore protein n=1 Tax=Lederbergia graminis TaxID=735518 RepID=A0ABW0LLL4_9BACI|nr:H-type small acid-soluble spore protein [Paenibacillus bovis]HLU23086.1 H-type small acid-soluble spore protein [Bacillaceae bacterium]
MERDRAQEIINASHMINVNYRGIPVYLQQINSDTATIFPLDEMHHSQEVDLDGLIESGP